MKVLVKCLGLKKKEILGGFRMCLPWWLVASSVSSEALLRKPNLALVGLADFPSRYVVGTRRPGAGTFLTLLMTEFPFTKHTAMRFVNITMPVDRSEVLRSVSGGPCRCAVCRRCLLRAPLSQGRSRPARPMHEQTQELRGCERRRC